MSDYHVMYLAVPSISRFGYYAETANSTPIMYTASITDKTAQEWEEWVYRTDGPYASWTLEKHRRDGLTHALYLFSRRLSRRFP